MTLFFSRRAAMTFVSFVANPGAPPPKGRAIDGANLSPVLLEGESPPQRALFWRFGPQRCVRSGPWKLYVAGHKKELYNLADDLGETNDLAAADPQRVKQLTDMLAAWQRQVEQSAAAAGMK